MSRLAVEAPRPSPPSARLLCCDQQLALQRCGGRIEQALARASRAERRHRAGRSAPRAIRRFKCSPENDRTLLLTGLTPERISPSSTGLCVRVLWAFVRWRAERRGIRAPRLAGARQRTGPRHTATALVGATTLALVLGVAQACGAPPPASDGRPRRRDPGPEPRTRASAPPSR